MGLSNVRRVVRKEEKVESAAGLKIYVVTNVPFGNMTVARSPAHAWSQLQGLLGVTEWARPVPKKRGEEWEPVFTIYPADQVGSYITDRRVKDEAQ